MESESKPNQNLNLQPKASQGLQLSESKESKSQLDRYLLGCFSVQKLYGRDIANAETVTELFHAMLGQYPAAQVLKAFELWLQRSQEFPTPADIIGIIKRKGKPPLSKEMFIAISKKSGEDRTKDDWQYLRDYEAELTESVDDFGDATKDAATLQENIRLRQQVMEQKNEIHRLNELLHMERMRKGIEPPKPSVHEQVTRTIETMKREGAKQEDIDAFAQSFGVAA